MRRIDNQIIKTLSISTLVSTFLLANDVPNIGSVEKEIKTPNIKKEQNVIPTISQKEYKAPMSDSGKTIKVVDFKISGNNHISSLELEKFYIGSRNKELTFNQLQDIASSITRYYREKGYFVARAYIPAQDIKANNNILEIAIIEGSYGKFKLNNNSLVKDSIVQSMLDDAKSRDNVISTNTLERAMLLINDTPGVIVTSADVMPGDEVGSSDFEITTKESKRVDGYIVTDNSGSRYTGEYRLMSGVNINSPFKLGDKISLFGLVSNGMDLKNGRLSYELPLASNGLMGELSYSQTNYSLTKEYENLDATGTSKTLEAKVSYPFIRSREENLNIYTSLYLKDLKDEVASTSDITKKDSKSIRVGLDYNRNYLAFNRDSNSTINFYLTYGNLGFNDATKESDDIAGANTVGNYSKANLDLTNKIVLTEKFTLESSLQLQYALGKKNLDGSEDFSIGGSSGVKLYPSGELSAENGYLFSTQLKYQLPIIYSVSNSIGLFYDAGRVFMADNTTDFNSRTLQDSGIGLYSSYKNFFSQLQVAWKVGGEDITSEPNSESRFLFQAGLSF